MLYNRIYFHILKFWHTTNKDGETCYDVYDKRVEHHSGSGTKILRRIVEKANRPTCYSGICSLLLLIIDSFDNDNNTQIVDMMYVAGCVKINMYQTYLSITHKSTETARRKENEFYYGFTEKGRKSRIALMEKLKSELIKYKEKTRQS